MPGIARKHVNAGSRRNPGFEGHAHKGDDSALVALKPYAGKLGGVIRAQQATRNVEMSFQ